MKKPLKWSLVTVGVMVLLPGLLGLDAIRRAVHVIDEQERRLQVEIAAERTRNTCDDVLRGLKAAPVSNACYEQSWRDRSKALQPLWSFARPQERIGENLLIDLARTVDATREAGATGMQSLLSRERRILEEYKRLLASPQPSAAQWRSFHETLGAIQSARPMPADFVRSQSILERMEVLRVLRRKEDPAGIFNSAPCWRELYSWRILTAKSLNQIEELAANPLLAEDPQLRWEDRKAEIRRLGRRDSHVDGSLPLFLNEHQENSNWTDWAMARTATAIKLFQVEKGRDPEQLQDLIPEYLTEIPSLSPPAQPLELRRNFGSIWSPDMNVQEVWPVLRK